jgi:glycosyltransferase involved in cell wall biosynthesis
MTRVAYDHQAFTLQAYGGVTRYFCELAERVGILPGFETRVIAPVHFNRHLAQGDAPRSGLHLNMRWPRTARLYRLTNRLTSGPMTRAFAPDILHRTYYDPTHVPARTALVVTVFDMIHELFADVFPVGDPTTGRKRAAVAQADLVLCISQSTANDLMRLFDVPAQKIRITYLGLSESLAHAASEAAPQAAGQRPYLLYVGHRHGYKNFAGALRAYAQSPRLHNEFDWVLFGGHPIGNDEKQLFATLGLRPDAVRRIIGNDDKLARVYAGAHAFVYPSKYEGFGIPPLEAMAYDCPVACSAVSSIPEVVGDAAEHFDPTDTDSIQSALETVCFNSQRRQWLVAQGRQRVGVFSWDRCAQDTARAYQALLGPAHRAGSRAAD